MESGIDRALAQVVSGSLEEDPAGFLADGSEQVVLARARYHGVLPLLARRVEDGTIAGPDWLIEAARAESRLEAAVDLVRCAMLREAVAALDHAGVRPLLVKGAALAHTHYEAPWLRPRSDSDVLVTPDGAAAAEAALSALGYRRALRLPGEWVSSQSSHVLEGPGGVEHSIDLHWRVNNSQVLGALVSHAEIEDQSIPLPALGPASRAPSGPHALLIACLHRVASEHAPYVVDGVSYFGGDRLIWLLDIDRLVRSLEAGERARFERLVMERGAGRLCAVGIRAATDAFATPGGRELASELSAVPRGSLVDRYLAAGPRGREWLDFRALPGARARLAFLRETFWPDAEYLRAREPARAAWPPALMRARRILLGLARRSS
jgi:hypothetical protein